MQRKVPPGIDAVEACKTPLTLRVSWRKGDTDTIDVSGLVHGFTLYASLRDDPDLFRMVRVGEHGADIVWPSTIDMSNVTLWRNRDRS